MQRIYRGIGFLAFLVMLASIPPGRTSEPEEASGEPQREESSEKKYSKYFFYDFEAPEIPPDVAKEMEEAQQKSESTVEATRFINMNATMKNPEQAILN